jgi:hypothetical protein
MKMLIPIFIILTTFILLYFLVKFSLNFIKKLEKKEDEKRKKQSR